MAIGSMVSARIEGALTARAQKVGEVAVRQGLAPDESRIGAAALEQARAKGRIFGSDTPLEADPSDPQVVRQVYGDRKLQARIEGILREWTNTGSKTAFQTELRKAWTRVLAGEAPVTDLEKDVAAVVASRPARWDRLAAKLGTEKPVAFHVFRGTKGSRFVDEVVKAWKDEGQTEVATTHHELTSWTTSRTIAENMAISNDRVPATVIYEADIPFNQSFADQWADGGMFYGYEKEVIVGTHTPNSLRIPERQVTVRYRGQDYGYDQRAALIQRWEADANHGPAQF